MGKDSEQRMYRSIPHSNLVPEPPQTVVRIPAKLTIPKEAEMPDHVVDVDVDVEIPDWRVEEYLCGMCGFSKETAALIRRRVTPQMNRPTFLIRREGRNMVIGCNDATSGQSVDIILSGQGIVAFATQVQAIALECMMWRDK